LSLEDALRCASRLNNRARIYFFVFRHTFTDVFDFSRRLLTVLQLTRMALVFTAIADSVTEVLLWVQKLRLQAGGHVSLWHYADGGVIAMLFASIGLYGFGMSLNDIIDRRRDIQMAAHRPLPSGRIGLFTAHMICTMLGLSAVIAGAGYSLSRYAPAGFASLALVIFVGLMITFYDFAGKYLVALGLLTLGLIRFFHAAIAAPTLPVVWHPLWLLNHVTILSTVAYQWEQKRPTLTRRHWWQVIGGLAGMDLVCIGTIALVRHGRTGRGLAADLAITPGLLLPVLATLLFIAVAAWIRWRAENIRKAGQTLMLTGLLWLIVYDAAFIAGYVDWIAAGVIALMLPLAYMAVQVMRWWSQIVALSQRPAFKRVET